MFVGLKRKNKTLAEFLRCVCQCSAHTVRTFTSSDTAGKSDTLVQLLFHLLLNRSVCAGGAARLMPLARCFVVARVRRASSVHSGTDSPVCLHHVRLQRCSCHDTDCFFLFLINVSQSSWKLLVLIWVFDHSHPHVDGYF